MYIKAFVSMVQSQVEAYKIDHHKYPTVEQLQDGAYLPKKDVACPDGTPVKIATNGQVETLAVTGDVNDRTE